MPKKQNPFALDFDTYILQSEPSKQEKGMLWQTAIGLQQVDGLSPSKYLNSLGFKVNNDPFEKNSWYFRNSLVRAVTVNVTVKLTANQKSIVGLVKELD